MQRFECATLTQIMHAVAAILRAPSGYSPLAQDWIIVPNRDTGRALEHHVARANGAIANTQWVTTETALETFFQLERAQQTSSLFWAIAAHLEAHHPVSTVALGPSVVQLTQLYQRYLTERPDWLLHWESGGSSPDLASQWQATLWSVVKKTLSEPLLHHALRDFFKQASELNFTQIGRVLVVCPERLSAVFMQWLQVVDRFREVWIIHTNPSEEPWFLDSSPQLDAPSRRFRDTLCRSRAQTLNTLLDTVGEPTQRLSYVQSSDSALSRLQWAVYSGTECPPLKPDLSLSLVDAPNPTREVEALHAWLIDQLNAHPEIRLGDVAIVTPDPGLYGPIIQRIFTDESPSRYIPTAPDPLIQQDLHDACLQYIVDCRRQGFSGQRLLDFLYHPAVQGHTAFSESDRALIHRWFVNAGAYRSVSAHKHSLDAARTRLVRGLVIDPETAEFRGGVATELAEQGHRLEWIFAAFEATEAIVEWQDDKTLEDWILAITEALKTLSQGAVETITLEVVNTAPPNTVPWSLVQTWIESQLQTGLSRPLHFDDRISVTSPQAVHAVPRRLIALLGANEGTLPDRQSTHPWDLMAQQGRRGDPNPSQQQTQWCFDLFMQATDALWVSWIGRNAITQQPEDPALAVMALRDVLIDAGSREHNWVRQLPRLHQQTSVSTRESPTTEPLGQSVTQAPTEPVLTLAEFLRVIKDPAAAFFGQQGARLQDGESPPLDLEPTTFSPLTRYQVRELFTRAPDWVNPSQLFPTLPGIPEDAIPSEIEEQVIPTDVVQALRVRRTASPLPETTLTTHSGHTLLLLHQYDSQVPRLAFASTRTHRALLPCLLDALVLCARQPVDRLIEVVLYNAKTQWIKPWSQEDAQTLLDGWVRLAYQARTVGVPVVMSHALEHAARLNKVPDTALVIDWTSRELSHRRGLRRLLEGFTDLEQQHRAFITQWVCPLESHLKASHADF